MPGPGVGWGEGPGSQCFVVTVFQVGIKKRLWKGMVVMGV